MRPRSVRIPTNTKTKMMETKLSKILILISCFYIINALPEPGIWEEVPYPMDKGYLFFVKSLYKDSIISVTIQCTQCDNDSVAVDFALRYTPCAQEYQFIEGNNKESQIIEEYLNEPQIKLFPDYDYNTVEFIKFSETHIGHSGYIQMTPRLNERPKVMNVTQNESPGEDDGEDDGANDAPNAQAKRKKREDGTPAANDNTPAVTKTGTSTRSVTSKTGAPVKPVAAVVGNLTTEATPNPSGQLVKAWKSGYYLFILRIRSPDTVNQLPGSYHVTVSMKGSVGFISAVEWPLLIFYGVMGLVYIFYGAMWLVMLACNWRDLMRLQYWIGAVIVLGMLEKAVFYGDYQSIANEGRSWSNGAVIFAEMVSSLKRALARMLVIIVSLGFGIVKPRLGTMLHKVLFVGGLFFIFATIEGTMRGLKHKGDQSTEMMLMAIPLAIIDACICYWVFSSLVETTRQLRLKRNIVKLNLYRHFTNTLVFSVLASIVFMVWSIVQIKTKRCIKDWQELWIDEAFWHLLFSVLLLIIMILWRPSINNQRYAFSPLLDHDEDEDEEDETVMNDAFDGIKMRQKQANGSPKQKQNTIEDELKWIEENIPASISDSAQAIIESDEEIMTAKYEISKMQ